MPMADIAYHAPETLDEAVALLGEHEGAAAPLAGGTDIVPALKWGVLAARHLVSLKRLAGLREVAVGPGGELTIGALVTLAAVATSPVVRAHCPALAEAAGQAGSPLLRNRGTLGGNVCLDTRCWYFNQTARWRASRPLCLKAGGAECYVNEKQNRCVALFSADTPAVLIVLGARVTLRGSAGARALAVEALYSGDGLAPIRRGGGEILTAITVPAPPPRWSAVYVKHSVRESIDFPVLGVAAGVALDAHGRIAEARVAITGATSAPRRLPEFEAALRGGPAPVEDERGESVGRALGPLFLSESVPHKRTMAGFMAVDAVRRAAAAARAGRAS